MAQKPQVVDLRRSFMPCDPDQYLDNLISTRKQDGEEKVLPIVPFEGYNFLPTSYGYRSYFGQNNKLGVAALTARTQFIIPYQTADLKTSLIALSEDGIHTCSVTDGGTWKSPITHTFNSSVFEEWTWCIIENILYCYKQGMNLIYKVSSNSLTGLLEITSFTPTFLNMAGQMGIFAAGTRLGMWDSLNSVSWSSNLDLEDFEPSIENLASNCIFAETVGRITTIRGNNGGFIIYATGSIVGVSYSEKADTLLWSGKKIINGGGVLNSRSVTYGSTSSEQFSFTSLGILRIAGFSSTSSKYEVEFIFPEVYDLFRESRLPIYVDCLHERFLCFQTFETYYETNLSYIIPQGIDPTTVALRLSEGYWDGDITKLPTILDGNMLKTLMDQWALGNTPNTSYTNC